MAERGKKPVDTVKRETLKVNVKVGWNEENDPPLQWIAVHV